MTQIKRLERNHWGDVRRIYLEGIASGNATFETDVDPDWDRWSERHLEFARIVAIVGGRVGGWAALSSVSDRCVYGGVAEVSVYVAEDARGGGIGSTLLQRLIEESEEDGIWTLQAGVFPENGASIALHDKFGFREVGRRERLGKINGVWRDVLLLERRSSKVGID